MILITHDLGIVAEVCETVGIMYAGEIVEYGPVEEIFENTGHPYTRGLFGAIPRLDTEVDKLQAIGGMMPDPMELPDGCAFHPRCPYAVEACSRTKPGVVEISAGHMVRCHWAAELPAFSAEDMKDGGNGYE